MSGTPAVGKPVKVLSSGSEGASNENSDHEINDSQNYKPKQAQEHIIRRESHNGERYDLELGCKASHQPCKLVIDTGACITVLSKRVYDLIPTDKKPRVIPLQPGIGLKTADGTGIKTFGSANIDFEIDQEIISHSVFIAEITDDGLLGMDFLRKHHCDLSFDIPALKIKGRWYKLKWSVLNDHEIARVTIAQDTTVQAGTQKVLPVKVAFVTPFEPYGVVEPISKDHMKYDVIVGRALIDSTSPQSGIPVANLGKQHMKIKKGTEIGHFFPTSEVISSALQSVLKISEVKVGQVKSCTMSDLPEYLHDLYNRSCVNLNEEEKQEFMQLLIKHQDVFAKSNDDLGTCNVTKHHIDTGQAKPIKQTPRRIPFGLQDEANKEIKSMLEKKVIRNSNSPWSSPVVLVRKKDNTLRFCIDYRKLNAVTTLDAYPLPRADVCLDELAGSRYFSCMDLVSGYWQLEMDESSIPKTAFSIPGGGHYEFLKLPFGLCGAPGSFQSVMDLVTRGLQFHNLLIYLDDIITYTKGFKQHINILDETFSRLKKAGLKLKPRKCVFFQEQVAFLGHRVSSLGVSPDPAKIERVKNWSVPTSVSQVKAFLGLCSYYRRFVKNFADIAAPLNGLLAKSEKGFLWTKDCVEAFAILKEKLVSAPIMGYPQKEGLYILDTDASQFAVGGVISQLQKQEDGSFEEKVIAYGSNSLNKSQRNYCTTRRELFAIKHFCGVYKHYLLGRRFKVRTDHSSLRWLLNFKSPEGILARWLEYLQQFDFEIEYRAGRNHGNCDGLSRQDPSTIPLASETVKQLPCGPCKHCITKDTKCNKSDPVRRIDSRINAGNVKESVNWCQQYTPEEIAESQKQDQVLRMVLSWLEEGEKPEKDNISSMQPELKFYWNIFDSLCLVDSVIYKKWFSDVGKKSKLLLVVPQSFHEEILKLAHNNISGGHLGVHKTVSKVKMSFFWYRLRETVRHHIRFCDTCQKRKKPPKAIKAPVNHQAVGSPLDRVNIDMLGKFPESVDGNRYVLVVTDSFSRFVEAYATRDLSAQSVAETLVYKFFCIYGTPYQLHSDQGSSFEAELFKQICDIYGIHKTRSSPAHPESNGLTEKFNSTLCDMLSKFVAQHQRDWDRKLPLLTSAYRSVEQASTKFTPNRLMFGREINQPISLIFPLPKSLVKNPKDFVHEVEQDYASVCNFLRENLQKTFETKDTTDNHRFDEHRFKIGDLVFWFDRHVPKGQSVKLAKCWKGPFVVIEILGNCLYRIRESSKKNPKVVHHNKLKACMLLSKDIPSEVIIVQKKAKLGLKIKAPNSSVSHYVHSTKSKELEAVKNLGKNRKEGRAVKLPRKFQN